ncbi:MAG: ATP-dependent helicase HrpB [Deltaproteobacteria bacterium]|nr:ATP-dependent helicase HrpB [Deltaproteobacteria bacterium]
MTARSRLGLPVDGVVPLVIEHLSEAGVVVITAPPGSGKTTRVPPAVLRAIGEGSLGDAADGAVWLVQPRRVAARLAAVRIAEEWGESPGETVGWKVRFEDRTGPRTRLIAMTEGMLLRQIQRDPFLEDVSVVVLDEVHERSLDLDLAMALLADLRRDARPDLRVVIMSATLEPEPYQRLFGDPTPLVTAEGRRFPVDVRYRPRSSTAPLTGQVAGAVRRMVDASTDGHVLAFLPGVGEIRSTAELLEDLHRDVHGQKVEVLPLHGRLSLAEQARALASVDHRKVVLATNIAETSVTLEGVVAVVDSGKVRQVRFDPHTGTSHLELVDISRASAEQRAGRAGRTRAGQALRLWTADQHRTRPAHDIPEMRRADLTSLLLRVTELGIAPDQLSWIEVPPPAALERARRVLFEIGAMTDRGLSSDGQALARLPVHPRLGAVVLRGRILGGLRAAATAAALVSEGNPWSGDAGRILDMGLLVEQVDGPPGRASRKKLHALRRVRDQLVRSVRGPAGRGLSDDELADCLLTGFPERLARRRAPGDLRVKLATGRGARLHRAEVLPHGEFCIAVELQGRGSASREDLIFLAAEVPLPLALTRAVWTLDVRFDAATGRVVCREVARVGALELAERKPTKPVDPAEIATVLLEGIRADPSGVMDVDATGRAWLARARFVAHHRPDLGIPTFQGETFFELLAGVIGGCRSISEVRSLGVIALMRASLTHPQRQAVERLAPESIRLPSGASRRLTYGDPAAPPILAARIQQLFGWTETPRVVGGRVPVLLHLLAPNQRPAQVTSDLASFWANTWDEVRRDLRGRYPKHSWPEDPLTAVAEDRPRRRRS